MSRWMTGRGANNSSDNRLSMASPLKRSVLPEKIDLKVETVSDFPNRLGRARNQVVMPDYIILARYAVLST